MSALASYPGPSQKERGPGTHRLRMRQILRVIFPVFFRVTMTSNPLTFVF